MWAGHFQCKPVARSYNLTYEGSALKKGFLLYYLSKYQVYKAGYNVQLASYLVI